MTRPATSEPEARSPWARLNWPARAVIRLYQFTLSPFVGGHCRFEPTCSRYADEAYRTHNPLHATRLTARRLLSCRPGGRSGFDPVPPYQSGPTPPNDRESTR